MGTMMSQKYRQATQPSVALYKVFAGGAIFLLVLIAVAFTGTDDQRTHRALQTCIECGGEADYAGSSTPKKRQHCKTCWLTIGALKPGSGASASDKKRAEKHIAFGEMLRNAGPGWHFTPAGQKEFGVGKAKC